MKCCHIITFLGVIFPIIADEAVCFLVNFILSLVEEGAFINPKQYNENWKGNHILSYWAMWNGFFLISDSLLQFGEAFRLFTF